MLAGAHGPDGPFGVKVVRERIVDSVDGRVVDELLIGPAGLQEAEAAGPIGGSGFVARRDRGQDAIAGFEDGRDEGLFGDAGTAEDAPVDLAGHGHSLSLSVASSYDNAPSGATAVALILPCP